MQLSADASRTDPGLAVAPRPVWEAERAAERYRAVRAFTERLCDPLAVEDYSVQSMPDASPAKWHLAHTTWFFETFVLVPGLPGYAVFHPRYGYLFNSYYNAVGERHERPRRGLLTRPTVDEVYGYRAHVDRHLLALLDGLDGERAAALLPVVQLGLHHEQQHQELLLTDLKHAFAANPLQPAYQEAPPAATGPEVPLGWKAYGEGVRWIGHAGPEFAFDNETPRHRVFLEAFALGTRLVTADEYLAFVEDGGYRRPELWLSDGWIAVQANHWTAPLYWDRQGGDWWQMTLGGPRPVVPAEPVCHVSYYEADAYARWAGGRLPTAAEWEWAAADVPLAGNFVESGRLHPAPAAEAPDELQQMFGDVWEWTSSAYAPYPRYRPLPGALGEYNGKFMCNQMVLRGGSCASPRAHLRRSYRNFFPPDARWQFSGIRLARDA
jgi:ergothioneine biosynthesis protein EgtB